MLKLLLSVLLVSGSAVAQQLGSPSVGQNTDGRLMVFVVSVGTPYYTLQNQDGNWSGWVSLGGALASSPSVGQNTDGRLMLFGLGTDGAPYYNLQVSGSDGSWSGWVSLGGALQFTPSVARNTDGRLMVFGLGTDGAPRYNLQVAGSDGSWSGWVSLGGALTSSPSVGQNTDGRLMVFGLGTDGAPRYNLQVAGSDGSWSGWVSLGGALKSSPSVARNSDGRLMVFGLGTDGSTYYNLQTAGSDTSWSGWVSMGGSLTSSPTVGQYADGRLVLFAIGNDGQTPYYNLQAAGSDGSWSGWLSLGGGLKASPTGARDSAGRLVAFGLGIDGNVYYDRQASGTDGTWSAWGSLGAQPLGCTTSAPIVNGPNNSSSAVFWYLGGAPSINGYSVSATLTIQPPSSGCVNPTIKWSTDSPSRLSITPSGDGKSAALTSLGASAYQKGFDIHVTVTYNGNASSPFPIFIDTPYTMTTSLPGQFCNGNGCGCAAVGYPTFVGYANSVTHGIGDLNGKILVPITTNESLEKQQWLNSTYSQGSKPSQSTWDPSIWNGDNTFTDVFWICAPSNTGLVPPLSSYNPNGTNAVFNETQKFWVGSGSHFQGACVQRGIVTLYSDHGAISPYYTPITNKSDCNQGNVIN